jgi:hypothetical protein
MMASPRWRSRVQHVAAYADGFLCGMTDQKYNPWFRIPGTNWKEAHAMKSNNMRPVLCTTSRHHTHSVVDAEVR